MAMHALPMPALQQLAALLRAERSEATVEFPGSIVFPHAEAMDLALDPALWWIGNNNGPWGADLMVNGDMLFSFELPDSQGWPLERVARELLAAICAQEEAQ